MSITVRSWSDRDLKKIKAGTDKWLSTIFMNAKTFGKKEISYYPYERRKTYVAVLDCGGDDEEKVKIYATDNKNAKKFLKAEYACPVSYIEEIKTKYKKVK